jgi:hypothetical protein
MNTTETNLADSAGFDILFVTLWAAETTEKKKIQGMITNEQVEERKREPT